MNRLFVSRRSAISHLIDLRNSLLEQEDADAAATLAHVTKLLIDVRAGRISDFVLPAASPVQIFINGE